MQGKHIDITFSFRHYFQVYTTENSILESYDYDFCKLTMITSCTLVYTGISTKTITTQSIRVLGIHVSCNYQSAKKWLFKKYMEGDFPGGPMVKTLPSNAGAVGSIPGQGAKIPYLMAKT